MTRFRIRKRSKRPRPAASPTESGAPDASVQNASAQDSSAHDAASGANTPDSGAPGPLRCPGCTRPITSIDQYRAARKAAAEITVSEQQRMLFGLLLAGFLKAAHGQAVVPKIDVLHTLDGLRYSIDEAAGTVSVTAPGLMSPLILLTH